MADLSSCWSEMQDLWTAKGIGGCGDGLNTFNSILTEMFIDRQSIMLLAQDYSLFMVFQSACNYECTSCSWCSDFP